MLKRKYLSLLAILTCCALTCVGFSSWVITGSTPSVTAYAGVNAETVIIDNPYFTAKEISVFEYYSDNFAEYDANGNVVGTTDTATISVKYEVNQELTDKEKENLKDLLDDGYLNTKFILKYITDYKGNDSFFDYVTLETKMQYTYTGQNGKETTVTTPALTTDINSNANEATVKYSWNCPNGVISTLGDDPITSFTFTFTFKVKEGVDFNEKIYPIFYNTTLNYSNNVKFTVNALVDIGNAN